jgi:hypothetical protein
MKVWSLYFIKKNFHKLDNEDYKSFNDKHGNLWAEIKTETFG